MDGLESCRRRFIASAGLAQPRVLRDVAVAGEFGALVPGQGAAQLVGQGVDRGGQGRGDGERVARTAGKVHEHQVTGEPLDQGRDR